MSTSHPGEAHVCIQVNSQSPEIFSAKGRCGHTLITVFLFPLKNHSHTYWHFLFPWRGSNLPKDSGDPQGYSPTWLSRKFHRLTLDRHTPGRSGNWEAQSEVSNFPFASLGAHIHGNISAVWQWGNTPATITVEFYSLKVQWFSVLAWHQYWCHHLRRLGKYWCHPGEEIPVWMV